MLFSGNIKNPVTKLTEGVNTYRVIPIIMKNKNADRIIRNLQKKQKQGKKITKKDLAPLMLCPLMGGQMPQKERIQTAFELTRSSTEIGEGDIRNMESVLYAMAEKFLEPLELKEIKGVIGMTTLSRMFYDDGVRDGFSQGKEMAQLEDAKKLLKLLSADKIAEVLEIPLDLVKSLQPTDKPED